MERFTWSTVLTLCALAAGACSGPPPGPTRDEVDDVVDAWHAAAAAADEDGYFDRMAADAVFLGTDASERWTRAEFQEYAHPHFAAGRGWTYRPADRHVAFAPDGRTAWFDEKLASRKYGDLRGTGVLRRDEDGWRIVHYSMTFTVPNDASAAVVELLRDSPGSTAEDVR